MGEWLRRIRGALGMGLTWAVGWVPIGLLLATVLFVVGLNPPGLFINLPAAFGVLGFLGGSVFSGVLRLTEGRHSFDQLSLPRFTAWGAVGGLLLGGLSSLTLVSSSGVAAFEVVVMAVTTLLGAGSAAATLAIARRADTGRRLGSGGGPDTLSGGGR